MSGSGWFVAYTNPISETKAKAWLEQFGAETYLPMYVKKVAHAGTVTEKPAPVFPRYLFFRKLPLATARNTPGVSYLVRRGIEFVVVNDHVINLLRGKTNANGYMEFDPAPPKDAPLREGERVRVTDGAFEGRIAIYQGMKDHDRVTVLLTILRRSLSVELPANLVKRER